MADTYAGTLAADLKFRTDFANLQKDLAKVNKIVSSVGKEGATAAGKIQKGWDKTNRTLKETSKNIWTVYGNFKDIFRVATGILMARAINSMLRAIMGAINALKEFNSLLETTRISFKYLMQTSIEGADAFIDKIEEIAARTPYTFETATTAAQRMLALGFRREQLMPMLEMMADLNAATGGGADQMESLAYAFGKVQAMGKMTTRELRLFVSANIPIYQILREELGLTEKDFQKLRISAAEAIPAILRGIQKFKGAAAEAEKTIPGLISSIHDYLLFLGQDLLNRFWESVRGVLTGVRETLKKLRDAIQKEGIYGFITVLFPPEMRQTLVIFIRAIQEVAKAVGQLIKAFGPLIQITLEFGARMATYIIPPLTALIRKISEMAQQILKAKGLIKLLVTVIGTLGIAVAIAGFVGMLAKAITVLGIAAGVSTAINWLSVSLTGLWAALAKNPWVALATIVAGAIVYIAMTSEWGIRMLDKLQAKMASVFGLQGNVVRSTGDWAQAMAKVNEQYTKPKQSLQDLIDSFSDVGDEADAANDEFKKFLASFDEVYNIPEATGALGGLGNLKFPDIELPDFTPIVDDLETITEDLGKIEPIDWEKILGISALIWIFAKAWRDILQWLKDLWDKIKKWWDEHKPDFTDWWKNIQSEWDLAWDGLKKAVLKALQDALKWAINIPVLLKVPDLVKWYNEVLVPTVEGWSIDIVIALALPAVYVIDEFLKNLEKSLGKAIDALPAPLAPAFAYILKFIKSMELAILAGDFKTFAFSLVGAMWAAMVKVPLAVVQIIAMAAWDWIKKAFDSVTTWLKNTNDNPILTSLVSALQLLLVGAISLMLGPGVAAKLSEVFKGIGTSAAPLATEAGTAAGLAMSTGFMDELDKTSLEDLSKWLGDKGTIGTDAKDYGSIIGSGIITGLKDGIEAEQTKPITAIDKVSKDIISNMMTQFGLHSPSTVFRQFGIDTIQGLSNGILSLGGTIKKTMDSIYTWSSEKLILFKDTTLSWGKSAMDNLLSGFNKILPQIQSLFKELSSFISNKFTTLINSSSDWGSNIIKGLIKGINSDIGALRDAIESAISSAIQAAKSILGIESPSKVFEAIGSNVVAGFNKGIQNGTVAGVTIPKTISNGVVNRTQIMNTTENIINRTGSSLSENSLTPFATTIANLIGGNNNSTQGAQVASDYVLVPVNKRDLERELYVIRKKETFRVAGRLAT